MRSLSAAQGNNCGDGVNYTLRPSRVRGCLARLGPHAIDRSRRSTTDGACRSSHARGALRERQVRVAATACQRRFWPWFLACPTRSRRENVLFISRMSHAPSKVIDEADIVAVSPSKVRAAIEARRRRFLASVNSGEHAGAVGSSTGAPWASKDIRERACISSIVQTGPQNLLRSRSDICAGVEQCAGPRECPS